MATTIVTIASKGEPLTPTDFDNNMMNLKATADAAKASIAGTAGKVITVTEDTSLDEAVAMSSKAPKESPVFTGKVTIGVTVLDAGVFTADITTAKTIHTDTSVGGAGSYCLIMGTNAINASFLDTLYTGAGYVVIISSNTLVGTPTARTYTRSGSELQLAMASGTYQTTVVPFNFQ